MHRPRAILSQAHTQSNFTLPAPPVALAVKLLPWEIIVCPYYYLFALSEIAAELRVAALCCRYVCRPDQRSFPTPPVPRRSTVLTVIVQSSLGINTAVSYI